MQRPPRLRVGTKRSAPRVWVQDKDERGSAHSRGYGVNWRRLREVVLQAEPLCRHCNERGRVTPAQEVDHIVPLKDGGTNDRDNLQPLCAPCHDDKTARDVRARRTHVATAPSDRGGLSKRGKNGGTASGYLHARGRDLHRPGDNNGT